MRLGRARDAPKPAQERSWDAPGTPRAAGKRPRATPGTVPRRSRARPERRRSACGATRIVERVIGTIFRCFYVVARKLRCAVRISFYNVLLPSSEVSSERARATKTLENQGVLASKIEPGSVRATQNRARAGLLARQNAKKAREAHRFLCKRTRTGRRSEEERRFCGSRARQDAKHPRAGATGMLIWYYDHMK